MGLRIEFSMRFSTVTVKTESEKASEKDVLTLRYHTRQTTHCGDVSLAVRWRPKLAPKLGVWRVSWLFVFRCEAVG